MSVRADLLKLVAFVVVAALGLGLVVIVFSDTRLTSHRDYGALFTDVSLLTAGEPVRYAGVPVGRVDAVDPTPDGLVRVGFSVDDDLELTDTTTVAVRYDNLVGDRYLALHDGAAGTPLADGAEIPAARTRPALDLDSLLGGFRPLLEGVDAGQVNELSANLVAVLQGEAGTVDALLKDARSLSGTLADRDEVIGRLVDELNAVLGTVDERDERLRSTIDRLQELVSGLAADREPIGQALERTAGLATTLSDLLAEARGPLRDTVAETGRTATVLDDGSATLEYVLRELPVAYTRLNRLGAYGNFFNFYLCAVRVKTTGPDGAPLISPEFGSNSETERCR